MINKDKKKKRKKERKEKEKTKKERGRNMRAAEAGAHDGYVLFSSVFFSSPSSTGEGGGV